MIISQGMCKGPGPWQVSGKPYLALWFPCHPGVRYRIRDDWRYAPSPSTSALWGICQQTRHGRGLGDVVKWIEPMTREESHDGDNISNRDSQESVFCWNLFHISLSFVWILKTVNKKHFRKEQIPQICNGSLCTNALGKPWSILIRDSVVPGFRFTTTSAARTQSLKICTHI